MHVPGYQGTGEIKGLDVTGDRRHAQSRAAWVTPAMPGGIRCGGFCQLPWSTLMSVVVTMLIVDFFITSSDSGSLVDDMVTSCGHPNPPRLQRVFRALAEGAVAGTLLPAGGLQAHDARRFAL